MVKSFKSYNVTNFHKVAISKQVNKSNFMLSLIFTIPEFRISNDDFIKLPKRNSTNSSNFCDVATIF